MARLTMTNLSKDFGATRAVDGVSLTVEDGEFLAILGRPAAARRLCSG